MAFYKAVCNFLYERHNEKMAQVLRDQSLPEDTLIANDPPEIPEWAVSRLKYVNLDIYIPSRLIFGLPKVSAFSFFQHEGHKIFFPFKPLKSPCCFIKGKRTLKQTPLFLWEAHWLDFFLSWTSLSYLLALFLSLDCLFDRLACLLED